MNVKEFYEYLCEQIPEEASCSWDNDGLMAAVDLSAEANRVLISLDASENAARYAAENGFNVLLTHHPMIFRGMKSATPLTPAGRRTIVALTGGVAVVSFHTRLDAAEGGVNDALCKTLGFTPDDVFGDAESPRLGRLVTLSEETTLRELAVHTRDALGAPFVKLTSRNPERRIRRLAVCGGDGKDFTFPALEAGAQALLTGSSGYNMAQDAAECGIDTLEAGHYWTEFPVCGALAEKLRGAGLFCEIYDSCMERTF